MAESYDGKSGPKPAVVLSEADRLTAEEAMIQDVTERKRAECEICRERQRLERMIDTAEIGIGFGDSEGRIFKVNEAFAQITGYSREELFSRRIGWGQLTAPEYAELDRRMMARLHNAGSAGPWEKEYIRKDGSRLPILVTCAILHGEPDEHVAFVLDLTERKQAEEELKRLNETLEQRVEQRAGMIRLLHEAASACHRAATVEGAVAFVLREFSRYKDWPFAQAFRPAAANPDNLLIMAEYYERTPGRFAQLREASESAQLRREAGFLARVFETTKPELVNDAREFPPARRDVMLQSGVRAMAVVPAMVGDEIVAVLEFFSDEPMDDDERIVQCMVNIGVQLGRVVERKRLERQIAEIASHEQQRIGRELHDTVTQQLTGAEMMLEGLRQRLEDQSSPHVQQAARIGEVVKDAHRQVRRLSRGLMPVAVDAAGLMNALQDLADQTEQMHGIKCDFQCDDDVFIRDSAAATQLYRIAQEAIHNAVKHAQPTKISVSLSASDRLRLTVRDDGAGMVDPAADRLGAGLRIMRYRAEVIGGQLEIKSRKGKGTSVTCELEHA